MAHVFDTYYPANCGMYWNEMMRLRARIKELEDGIEELYDENDVYRAAAELFEIQRDQARESLRAFQAGEGEIFINGKRLWENMGTGEWTTDPDNRTGSVPPARLIPYREEEDEEDNFFVAGVE